MGDKKQQTRPKRIFINDVDGYSCRHIAMFLSTCSAREDSEEAEETLASRRPEPAFQVVGTESASNKDGKQNFLLEQYKSPTRDELFDRLLECDVVVYNISEGATQQQIEEATWAITALHAERENFKSRKIFILVSTVMTWAMTKPHNLAEPNAPLTEEEFKRRRPHPSFRNHYNLEKLVLQLGKGKNSKLRCYVVACGLQYGKGENLFHYFFKVSWLMQFPEVPLFGQGTNYIPMIHVCDIGGVLQNIINLRPKSKYILAVDDSKNTLEDIVTTISVTLGPGKINKVPEQEAIVMKAFKPEELVYLSLNLHLEAFIIKDSFSLSWVSEAGMVQNMKSIAKEYRQTRQLIPIRICLVGPPAVGKTTIAEKLCHHYQIHHIQIKEVMEEKFTQLREMVNGAGPDTVSEEVADAAQKLENIDKSMDMNDGRLAEELLYEILQEKLSSNPCRNQGFVLDGFPKTYEQAHQVFSDEEQGLMYRKPVYNKMITPEFVFALNASDEFLTKRAQELPQSVAEKLRCTQEEFLPRLTRYRQRSAAEETLLDFFDELEIHPDHIEVTAGDPKYTDVMKKITKIVGLPEKYGRSSEEERKKEEERKRKVAAEAAEKKSRNKPYLVEMVTHEDWQRNLSEVNSQENELQEARALPLRNYLMTYVMPSLTEAMVECCKIKPEDPVEFLAEHLLQNSQQEEESI